eukprot:759627-Hanusia_phi.AAC.4
MSSLLLFKAPLLHFCIFFIPIASDVPSFPLALDSRIVQCLRYWQKRVGITARFRELRDDERNVLSSTLSALVQERRDPFDDSLRRIVQRLHGIFLFAIVTAAFHGLVVLLFSLAAVVGSNRSLPSQVRSLPPPVACLFWPPPPPQLPLSPS